MPQDHLAALSVDPPLLSEAAAWSSGLDLADVPTAVLAAAKRCIIDLIGVALPGSREPVARQALAHALAAYGEGPCQLFGSQRTASPLAAALANGTAAHALDYDDTSYTGILHGTAVVWPAALAAAEQAGASGAEAVTAFIAGVEVEYAAGTAMGDALCARGCWTTAALGVLGAATAAARVLRLGPEVTAHALALAVCQSSGLRSVFGTSAKPYLCGRAAQLGLDAAMAAASGIAAPSDALEGLYGLSAVLAGEPPSPTMFRRLGRLWSLVDPGVAFKLYPACSAGQAAAEATCDLLGLHKLSGEEVETVICEVPPFVATCLRYDRPKDVAEARFSLPFAVGSMLAFGRFGLDELHDEVVRGPAITPMLGKVSMVVNDVMASTVEEVEGAIVTVTTRDGRRFRQERRVATGMASRPMSAAAADAKFRDCAGRVLDLGAVEDLLARLKCIETLPSIAG